MKFLAPEEQLCIRTPLIKLWLLPISSSSSSSSEESEITATLFRFLDNDGGGEVLGVDWAEGFGEVGVVTGPGFFLIAIKFTLGS